MEVIGEEIEVRCGCARDAEVWAGPDLEVAPRFDVRA
jgi:hypothetical protein